MECGKSYLLLRRKTARSYFYGFFPLLCKSWVCERCRQIKAKKVRRFINTKFGGRPLWMLSVTYFHGGSAESAWRNIGHTCNRLLTYARKYSGSFSYVRVVEPHADGLWPHIHILCTKPIATERFVKLLTAWGFGWNFHCVQKSSPQAAGYVSKYLSKPWPAGDAEVLRVISRTRIVTCSRNLGAIFATDKVWECVDYERPPIQSEFLCNFIINKLRDQNCSFVLSTPCLSGFIIESDIYLSNEELCDIPDQYCWRFCTDNDYKYMPYGLQQAIILK